MDVKAISLRHLKSVLCLSRTRSLSAAANELRRSQPAVSRAVSTLESVLGVAIFSRTSAGFQPTPEGEALITRAASIAAILAELGEEYAGFHKHPRNPSTIPFFSMDISAKRLQHLCVLNDKENLQVAATAAGLSISAFYKIIHDLELQLDLSLFAHLPKGRVIAVGFGERLCERARLVLSEVEHALGDIQSVRGFINGRVRIGALPSIRPLLLPHAIGRLTKKYPLLSVVIEDGHYSEMARALVRGEIDVIAGGTRSSIGRHDLITEFLIDDQICVFASADHDLTRLSAISAEDLSQARWVLPNHGTPPRLIFENCLQRSGVMIRPNLIETSSTTAQRGLLLSEPLLTVGSVFQFYQECKSNLLVRLPYKLPDDTWPVGLTMRKSTAPSAGTVKFVECIRVAIGELTQ
ncbi:MAG: LysR family transcriptional regulator [Hyphomonadaceae bacterium]|nr:LysR family transcriptional regulator [Hyphomonadaceae bacterium]